MAGQLWSVNTLGGYFYSGRLSNNLRTAVQPMLKWRQFCDAKDETASGKKKGDKFQYDIVFDVQTQGTTLVETNTMPETNFKIAQGEGTLTEWGNSIPWTGKLETLAQLDVRRPIMTALANDTAKALDLGAFNQFKLTKARVVGVASGTNSYTYDGTATATNTAALYKANITLIRDTMRERNVPYYDGSNYMCVAHPTTLAQVKSDLESVNQYTETGYAKLVNGEIGKYNNVRFVEQTGIAKSSIGTWTSQNKSNWAIFFGEDTVMEGIAVPEETRAKIPQDYGRDKGIAWYALLGFSIVHAWSATDDSGATQARIFAWDSKA